MDEDFLEEYLKSPEEHMQNLIEENGGLRLEIAGLKFELEDEKAAVLPLPAELDTLKDLVSGKDGETLLILNELIDTKRVYEISVEENNNLQSTLSALTAKHERLVKGLKDNFSWVKGLSELLTEEGNDAME